MTEKKETEYLVSTSNIQTTSQLLREQEDAARVKLKRLDFGEEARLPGDIPDILPDYGIAA